MRIIPSALFLALATSVATAQAPATHPPAPATQPAAPASATKISPLLQPALSNAQQTIGALKTDKWKKGTVRDEADGNINSIQRDLAENMPPLLASADAAPASVSAALPLSRHIDALYDVMLRVLEAARVSAPPEQIAALQQSMSGLDKARHAFNDRLQEEAAALEKRNGELQATVQSQQAAKPVAAPAPAPCPTPATPKKSTKKKTPASTSTAPASGTPKP